MELVGKVLKGDRLALARLITQIENQTEAGLAGLDALFPHTGRAHLIGITGSPGSGKSSLVNRIALTLRRDAVENTPPIAIVAVDPTSPFSGGALLGDRVRMRELMADPGVFIRSMASRGALGGLAHTTASVVQVLDAAGFDPILIETVGAGQTEVEVARLAHTIVVVEAPGMGDDIQAIKAGILEIADILVVNKSDHPGADNTLRALKGMVELAHHEARFNGHHGLFELTSEGSKPTAAPSSIWLPPVIQTIATQGEGVEHLLDEIRQHWLYLNTTQQRIQVERERLSGEFNRLMKATLFQQWQASTSEQSKEAVLEKLFGREISPQQAVTRLIASHSDFSKRLKES